MSTRNEIVAAAMVTMMSFIVTLTLAYESNMTDEAARYKQNGISMVPKGCQDTCGNVSIYYPFGTSEGCYLDEWFYINCTTSSDGAEKPYLSFFSNDSSVKEILGISFESSTITLKQSISPVCQTTTGLADGSNITIIPDTKLSQTPFFYSNEYNKFMLLGCGNALLISPGYDILGGCTSLCVKFTARQHSCYGENCCQFQINPYYIDINTYQVNFTNSAALNACSYAFVVDQDWFPESFPSSGQEEIAVPVVWRWSIPQLPPYTPSDYCHRDKKSDGSYSDYYYYCDCPYPKIGNPLIANGCHGGPMLTAKELSAIIGVSASFGFLLLLWACFILYKAIKKRKIKKLRKKFFKRNGGLLLQQQLLTKEGTIEKAKIFTAIDDDEDRSLVTRFLLCMEENSLWEILDVQVSEQGKKEDVMAVAWLAQRCLNYNGKKRPTMKEVAAELDAIRASNPHLASAMKTLETESSFI
nr:wall-associated receptor kinase-like 1 [Ipomoea batatas]